MSLYRCTSPVCRKVVSQPTGLCARCGSPVDPYWRDSDVEIVAWSEQPEQLTLDEETEDFGDWIQRVSQADK